MTGVWGWARETFDHADAATLAGAVLGALVAAHVAVLAYVGQQREQRRQARATLYAEALRSVEDYLEAPYRVKRRDGSAESRTRVTDYISDVQSRIVYHQGLLHINGDKAVSEAYCEFASSARRDAGPQMTAAWRNRPTKRDRDVPIKVKWPKMNADAARTTLLAAMKADIRTRRWYRLWL